MSRKIVEQSGSLLALVVLTTILWYAHSPALYAGSPYLGSAACVCSFCIPNSFLLRMRLRKGEPPQTLWPFARRVRVPILAAWQLAILGLLNIWTAGESDASRRVLVLSGLLLALNIVIADYSRYVYALSSLTVMCLALSTNLVLRATNSARPNP